MASDVFSRCVTADEPMAKLLPPMLSFTLESGVTFTYTDSGPIGHNDAYTTLVIIHGHTFHAGTFQRLHPLAAANGLRVVCINRREYDGSSLYPEDELAVFTNGTLEERMELVAAQGRDLALCVDGIIQTLALPKSGGVALLGWSMGTVFLCSLLASIDILPVPTKARLAEWVHTAIIFRAAFSSPTPTRPLPPADRPVAFAHWVSAFFEHGDLSTRDLSQLVYPAPTNPAPDKTPTLSRLTPTQLASMVSFDPGSRYDDLVSFPPYHELLHAQAQRALWDNGLRTAWARMHTNAGGGMWVVYGTAEVWNVIHAGWVLEDQSREHPDLAMRFQVLEGVNHFIVWEDPQRALNILKQCLPENPASTSSVMLNLRSRGSWGFCAPVYLGMRRMLGAVRRLVLRGD
ncbi:Alpha/Beta hydrolase protein [Mycena amicta]|nr:Alpha/Beta hydrolase protein [Mycena amicta]